MRQGGWVLRIYEHSLSLAFLGLFVIAFTLHLLGGQRLYNEERLHEGERDNRDSRQSCAHHGADAPTGGSARSICRSLL